MKETRWEAEEDADADLHIQRTHEMDAQRTPSSWTHLHWLAASLRSWCQPSQYAWPPPKHPPSWYESKYLAAIEAAKEDINTRCCVTGMTPLLVLLSSSSWGEESWHPLLQKTAALLCTCTLGADCSAIDYEHLIGYFFRILLSRKTTYHLLLLPQRRRAALQQPSNGFCRLDLLLCLKRRSNTFAFWKRLQSLRCRPPVSMANLMPASQTWRGLSDSHPRGFHALNKRQIRGSLMESRRAWPGSCCTSLSLELSSIASTTVAARSATTTYSRQRSLFCVSSP